MHTNTYELEKSYAMKIERLKLFYNLCYFNNLAAMKKENVFKIYLFREREDIVMKLFKKNGKSFYIFLIFPKKFIYRNIWLYLIFDLMQFNIIRNENNYDHK